MTKLTGGTVEKAEAPTGETTPYRLDCPTDGPIYLTREEYTRQMSFANREWQCPRCGNEDSRMWNDRWYETQIDALEDPADDH